VSDAPDNVVLRHLRDIRRDLTDQRTLLLSLVDQGQRHDRSFQEVRRDMQEIKRDIHEVKDDLWIMLKAELMGRMGNFETRFEARLEALETPRGED
jgi:uncharacterized protein YeeX (DUF496 family)